MSVSAVNASLFTMSKGDVLWLSRRLKAKSTGSSKDVMRNMTSLRWYFLLFCIRWLTCTDLFKKQCMYERHVHLNAQYNMISIYYRVKKLKATITVGALANNYKSHTAQQAADLRCYVVFLLLIYFDVCRLNSMSWNRSWNLYTTFACKATWQLSAM